MKVFKTTDHGEFGATHVLDTLSLHGERSHVHLAVPEFMQAEARRIMRRPCGDDVLEFAELLQVHEVALAARIDEMKG